MAAETIYHPNNSDATEGYASISSLLAGMAATGWFPYQATVDVGHSSGASAYRLSAWSNGAATGTEAEYIAIRYADVTRGANFDVTHRFNAAPGVFAGLDPALVFQAIPEALLSVPAFSNSISPVTNWAIGLVEALAARGAFEATPTVSSEWIVSTDGAQAGNKSIARFTMNYNPTGGEHDIGIGQAVGQGFWVASNLDTERVLEGSAALGEVLVNDPQIILSSGSASAEWSGLADSAQDIAGFLEAQEAILEDMRNAAQDQAEDLRAPLGYSILSPLGLGVSTDAPTGGDAPDAGIAAGLEDVKAAWPDRPASMTPGGMTILTGGSTLPAVVVASTAFLASLTSAPAMVLASVVGLGMAGVVAYNALPLIQSAITSLASSVPEKLQSIADNSSSGGDAYALVERIADALERQADSLEAIEVVLTGGEVEPVLADHIKALSENLLLLAESKSIVKLATKGMVATAHVGHLTVVEEETEP